MRLNVRALLNQCGSEPPLANVGWRHVRHSVAGATSHKRLGVQLIFSWSR